MPRGRPRKKPSLSLLEPEYTDSKFQPIPETPNIPRIERPITAIGVHKIDGLYRVTKYTISGEKIVASEDINDGDVKSIALEDFKIASAKEFWMPKE